ncbi:MAG: hypothetical protein LBH74_01415 [Nitrososphaerota archaeon]|jgi:hypothetical protein|nr:hypothetical protein [Nitrososphaerota archaeon]
MNTYAYQRPVGKIEDISELRNEFIVTYDTKNKAEAVHFGLLLGRHLIDITGIEPCEEILKAFDAMHRWLNGKTNYHEARNIAFCDLYKCAREENDPIKLKFYKTMAQIASFPM